MAETNGDVSQTLSFNNIILGGIGGSGGPLKITASGFGWRNSLGKTVTVSHSEISKTEWVQIARTFQLRIHVKGGSIIKFEGFREQDFQSLSTFIEQSFGQKLSVLELCIKGQNCGDLNVRGTNVYFEVDNKEVFELSIPDIAQVNLQKNELVLEMHQDDTERSVENDSLVEIRFYVPPTDKKAETLKQEIMKKADIIPSSGSGIVTFSNVPVLLPRGRYEIELFASFVKFHGKTYDYKVLHSSVCRMFTLQKPDDRHQYFVVSTDPPIRQGQTRYPHIVIQLPIEEKISVNINLPKEILAEKYKNKLQPVMSGKSYVVMAEVFRALTGKKISGSSSYKSKDGQAAIRCSYKAYDGFLYPLETSFFFVHKPPKYIAFSEIIDVEFSRVSEKASGGGTRNFDIIFNCRGAGDVQFTNIPRSEYDNLYNYMFQKKLKIKGERRPTTETTTAYAESSDDEVETKIRIQGEDEESEEDDDYAPEEEPDIPEEYDSQAEPSDHDDEEKSENGSDKSSSKKKQKRKRGEEEGSSPPKKKKRDEKEKEKEKEKDRGKERTSSRKNGKEPEKKERKEKEKKDSSKEREKERKDSSSSKEKEKKDSSSSSSKEKGKPISKFFGSNTTTTTTKSTKKDDKSK